MAENDGVVFSFTPRFYEIDAQNVMFNMWYLGYVDEAVTAFFEDRGLAYSSWEGLGVDVQVVHAELDWRDSVKIHDRVEVLVGTARIGTKSFTLDFAFRKEGRVTCTGQIVYAVISPETSQSVPVPERLAKALEPVGSLKEKPGAS